MFCKKIIDYSGDKATKKIELRNKMPLELNSHAIETIHSISIQMRRKIEERKS